MGCGGKSVEMVNFYVPSEAQILLNPDTSVVSMINYQFHIIEQDDQLRLQLCFESYTDTEEIPEPVCKQICDMAYQHRLTNAAVNQLLLPLKIKLIQNVPELEDKTQINISKLFTSAKGYVSKENNPVAIFTDHTLCPDVFNNKYSICFTIPVDNQDQVILLTSKEYLLQERESALFVFRSFGKIYQATAMPQNGIFHLQQIIPVLSMQHQDMFETEHTLSDIYRRFTMKKNRLNALVNKI